MPVLPFVILTSNIIFLKVMHGRIDLYYVIPSLLLSYKYKEIKKDVIMVSHFHSLSGAFLESNSGPLAPALSITNAVIQPL